MIDRHDLVGTAAGEADGLNLSAAMASVERRSPAAFAVGIDEIGDRRFDAGLGERDDCELLLPGAIGVGAPLLQRAAAARAEMRADRLNALRARCEHTQQPRAITLPLHLDRLAWQRVGHIDRALQRLGDSIAAVAHAGDR